MSKKFKVVCMIGSMKFYDTMLQEETRLTDMGYIVLHPVKSEYIAIPEHIKKQYDDEIRVKIDMSDIIYVIDVDGYIGKSTESEIKYAEDNHKKIVKYIDKFNELTEITDSLISECCSKGIKSVALIGSSRFEDMFQDVYKTLSRLGFVVHAPAIFGFSSHEIANFTDDQHRVLDLLHEHKIKISEYVLCIDGNNYLEQYIGDDTVKEIEYALTNHPIIYCTSTNGLAKLVNHHIDDNK